MNDSPDEERVLSQLLPKKIDSDDAAATNRPQLILASRSPRRQALLSMTGVPFASINADIDESRLTQSIMKKYDHEAF